MEYNIDFLKDLPSGSVKLMQNEPMSRHTSFRIGGNADILCDVHNLDALTKILSACKQSVPAVPITILGKGSNVLVSDAGIRGLVLRLKGEFTKIRKISEDMVFCGAGVSLAALCVFCKENALTGLEFAWGIPGSVGGAVYMNAGAYGGEIRDVVTAVSHVSSDGTTCRIDGENLDFGYRHSVYFDSDKIITGAFFKFKIGNPDKISSDMENFMRRRHEKQPLELPSAGSVFKRPHGYYAAALIEECGLKGAKCGGAAVSLKHSGFVVNTGGASCKDVLDLIARIQKTVLEKKGVNLVCEIRCIGQKNSDMLF